MVSPRVLSRVSRPIELTPGGTGKPCIVVISDSTGETAKTLLTNVLCQFDAASQPAAKLYGYVLKPRQLAEILTEEMAAGHSSVVVLATFVEPNMVRWLTKLSAEMGVESINIMAPMLREFNDFLGSDARGVPGAGSNCLVKQELEDKVSEEFMRMIEAGHYARCHEDSRQPSDWEGADLILVGVSRSGKSGIASFLAQRGKKVACVKVGSDRPAPDGLCVAERSNVVLVTRSADAIVKRRKNRMMRWKRKGVDIPSGFDEYDATGTVEQDLMRWKRKGVDIPSGFEEYDATETVEKDLGVFNDLVQRHPEWIGPLDCTYVCEDETALQISNLMRDSVKQSFQDQSSGEGAALPLLLGLVPVAITLGALLSSVRPALPALTGRAESSRSSSALAGAPGVQPSFRKCLRGLVAAAASTSISTQKRLREEGLMREEIESMVSGTGGNPTIDKTVYVVSDMSGQTARLVLSRLLVQYSDLGEPNVRLFDYVDAPEKLDEIVLRASNSQREVLIFATLVKPQLSQTLKDSASRLGVRYLNIMPPLLEIVQSVIGGRAEDGTIDAENRSPDVGSGRGPIKMATQVNASFFQMAEAVQFTQQHIAGVNSQEWPQADVLLLGPSRVGKETLAYYLAQRGIKVACFTTNPSSSLPLALLELDPKKVVLLTMAKDILLRRRECQVREMERKKMPMLFEPTYTNVECIELELSFISSLASAQASWRKPIDVTEYDVPELADIVLEIVKKCGSNS